MSFIHRRQFKNAGLGRLRTGERNKQEAEYEQRLELLRRANEISWYKFEGLKFRLADKTFYTPDFVVMQNTGLIELHEVKGFMQDDANVKIKVVAELYPFVFKVARKVKGVWEINEI